MEIPTSVKKRMKKRPKEVSELEADSYLKKPVNTEREVVSTYAYALSTCT